jgi:sec-independent protein translocase protein TatA
MSIGPPEIILVLLVLVLLFGARKLPELARGSGRALRIFKAETKGLMDDDDRTPEQRQVDAQRTLEPPSTATQQATPPTVQPTVQPPAQPTAQPTVQPADRRADGEA